jgi:hypothetical protein
MEVVMDNLLYEGVYPVGRSTAGASASPSHISNFSGKTICGDGPTFFGDEAITKIVELLRKQYPDIKYVPSTEFLEEVSTKDEIAKLQDLFRGKGCDVVLSGNGC